MAGKSNGAAFKITTLVTTFVAVSIARKLVQGGWKAVMGTAPPGNPEDPEVSAREAIGWALVSGMAIGMTRMVATRGVTRFFRDLYSELPEDASKVA